MADNLVNDFGRQRRESTVWVSLVLAEQRGLRAVFRLVSQIVGGSETLRVPRTLNIDVETSKTLLKGIAPPFALWPAHDASYMTGNFDHGANQVRSSRTRPYNRAGSKKGRHAISKRSTQQECAAVRARSYVSDPSCHRTDYKAVSERGASILSS